MAQMMRAAGNEHLLTRLDYPGAGHLIEPPYSPHFRATKFIKEGQKGELYRVPHDTQAVKASMTNSQDPTLHHCSNSNK